MKNHILAGIAALGVPLFILLMWFKPFIAVGIVIAVGVWWFTLMAYETVLDWLMVRDEVEAQIIAANKIHQSEDAKFRNDVP